MSYIKETLRPDEEIFYRTTIHWWVYTRAAVSLGVGVALMVYGRGMPEHGQVLILLSYPVFIYAFFAWAKAFIQRWSTELIVTDRRVIAKFGLIRRHTYEINADKIEGVEVDQSILGRIIGFGDIVVTGTGSGSAPVMNVGDPIGFRNAIGQLLGK